MRNCNFMKIIWNYDKFMNWSYEFLMTQIISFIIFSFFLDSFFCILHFQNHFTIFVAVTFIYDFIYRFDFGSISNLFLGKKLFFWNGNVWNDFWIFWIWQSAFCRHICIGLHTFCLLWLHTKSVKMVESVGSGKSVGSVEMCLKKQQFIFIIKSLISIESHCIQLNCSNRMISINFSCT